MEFRDPHTPDKPGFIEGLLDAAQQKLLEIATALRSLYWIMTGNGQVEKPASLIVDGINDGIDLAHEQVTIATGGAVVLGTQAPTLDRRDIAIATIRGALYGLGPIGAILDQLSRRAQDQSFAARIGQTEQVLAALQHGHDVHTEQVKNLANQVGGLASRIELLRHVEPVTTDCNENPANCNPSNIQTGEICPVHWSSDSTHDHISVPIGIVGNVSWAPDEKRNYNCVIGLAKSSEWPRPHLVLARTQERLRQTLDNPIACSTGKLRRRIGHRLDDRDVIYLQTSHRALGVLNDKNNYDRHETSWAHVIVRGDEIELHHPRSITDRVMQTQHA